MFHDETSFLPQKLDCERVRNHHEHHRYVEREQRAENEERSIVDNTLHRFRHDVVVVDDSCNVMRHVKIEFLVVRACLPKTVMEEEISMARSHTSAILKLVKRFVELWREPSGFLMPKYLPRLMKHMCRMLAEHANTSHVT